MVSKPHHHEHDNIMVTDHHLTMPLKLTIIGCGRLGKTLAFLWKRAELVRIQDIYNTSLESTENAVAFIGEGSPCQSMSQFRPADIYLIATPDDQIGTLCQILTEQPTLHAGSVVFHCSGLKASDRLNAAKRLGCYTASVHPIFSFSDPAVDVHHFSGAYCSFEGSSEAMDRLAPLMKGIGAQLFQIAKEHKGLYHVASVFAANYVMTLASMAENCYRKAELPAELARSLVHQLMLRALGKVARGPSLARILTGPLQRGDRGTLEEHLRVLRAFPHLQQAYQSLGKATIQELGQQQSSPIHNEESALENWLETHFSL